MKRLSLLTLLLFFSFTPRAQAANIGGLEIDLQFCRDFDKWSGIISAYSNVQFPVTGGAVGVTTGLMQNTSIVTDFCQFMTQMASLDAQGQIFAAMNFANQMSDNQHIQEIGLMRDLWDFRNTVWDPDSNSGRKGVFESASTHRRLANLIKTSSEVHDKHNPNNPIGIQSKARAEADMGRLARLAYKRALIKEASDCPKPKSDKDYGKLYEKEVAPQERLLERDREYEKFYFKALLSMGRKICNPVEYKTYVNDLNNLKSKSSFHLITIKTKKSSTTKLEANDSIDPADPTAEKVKEVESQLDQKYQVFKTLENTKYLKNFTKKYSKIWKMWVASKSLKSRGLARTDGQGGGFNSYNKVKLENEFKDFSILCNRGKIAQTIPRSTPNYYNKINDAQAECKATSTKEISKAGGLMQFYAKDLAAKARLIKTYQGNIWTFESFYMGNFRTIDQTQTSDAVGNYAQEEVKCAPIKNLAIMNKMALKQNAVNTELNQMIVEQMFKQNSLREQEEIRKAQEEKELRQRQEVQEEMERRKSVEYHKYIDIPQPEAGGF